jgi:serine/threonine-protein kinase
MSTPPPTSMPYGPGAVVGGRYRVERMLGSGGMGWVVVATHLQLEQRVAIKFLHAAHAAANPQAVARFLREAKAAARIQSEYVTRVSDFGTLEDGSPYLVMEYLEGQDLESLLRSRGCLPASEAVDYVLQACEGLAEAHAAGIVHRDLKPANLFLARRSNGSARIKLLDFGISKLVAAPGRAADGNLTSTTTLMGSPLYMSPEQMRSLKTVDHRADVWAMGIILYEMLAGRSPFEGETLPEVCARIMADPAPRLRSAGGDVPERLEAAILRCLEKEPERRHPDVASLARDLAPFGSEESRRGAERIGRITGPVGPVATNADARPAPSYADIANPVAHAQTQASFGRTSGRSPGPRRLAVPAAIAALSFGIAVVATLAISGSRSSARLRPTANAVAPPPEAAAARPPALVPLPAPNPPASAAPVASETLAPPAPPAPSATAAARAPVSAASPTSVRPAPGVVAPRPASKSKASPANSAGAAPAPTNGFGGRD